MPQHSWKHSLPGCCDQHGVGCKCSGYVLQFGTLTCRVFNCEFVQCSVLGESGRNFQSLHVHTAHSKSISQCSLSVFSFLETPHLNVNLGYEFGVKSALPSSQLGKKLCVP